jgi:hypothetical protein
MARDYEKLVRDLYAKANAEGVTPQEKEECERLAKYHMMKHGVAHVLQDATVKSDKILHTEYAFAAPFADQKAALYNGMASAFNCRVVKTKRNGSVVYTLVGFKADYDRLEFMFRIILNQAFRDVTYVDIPVWENKRSFKISWWYGFTAEVVRRLEDSKKTVLSEASSAGYAVAIRDRDELVDDEVSKLFPVLRKGKARKINSYDGYAAGRVSGRNAELHDKDELKNRHFLCAGD